ncbi:3'-5' exonuclease family protein [Neolewinella aurantiaca]|uniref:hypothetical protein n=1 Tax=Neolewinella aurantiaca TaxID=2602767 RepID=UPI001650049A|nr:hypothetical protein [Neolewinella aurantiaca]
MVSLTEPQDYNQLIRSRKLVVPAVNASIYGVINQAAVTKEIAIAQAIIELTPYIRQADIIVGHNIAQTIAILLAAARRNNHQAIIKMLTHPHFGFDLGNRAAICTQQLAGDYLRFLGQSPSSSDTELAVIYHRIFGEDIPHNHDIPARALASQRVYDFLSTFKQKHENEFLADIVFF